MKKTGKEGVLTGKIPGNEYGIKINDHAFTHFT